MGIKRIIERNAMKNVVKQWMKGNKVTSGQFKREMPYKQTLKNKCLLIMGRAEEIR